MNLMEIIDQEVRNSILADNKPYLLVDASAGAGKTTIMVEKANWYIHFGHLENYQQVLMITFTRLATRQIRDKVEELLRKKETEYINPEYIKNFTIKTTEAFINSEVIRPFVRDALGRDFPEEDFLTNYYDNFNTYESGKKKLQESKVLGAYNNKRKNFSYELALDILRKSYNARECLKARYPIIMIDEYQDVDADMHKLFMYLKNTLKIKLFIVGDIKQGLYGFKGADPEIFRSLSQIEQFKSYQLIKNFRSHASIVDYSYHFFESNFEVDFEEDKVYLYNSGMGSTEFLSYINKSPDESVAYLFSRRNQWFANQGIWEKNNFVYLDNPPLDSGFPNFDILEPVLKIYHDHENYNIFEMLEDMSVDLTDFNQSLAERIQIHLSSQNEKIFEVIEKLLNKKITASEKTAFQESQSEKWKPNFSKKQIKRVAMTIHAAKGLEFDHVYLHADSFYPPSTFHGMSSLNKEQHYVAITRPKKSLYIELNSSYKALLLEKEILE